MISVSFLGTGDYKEVTYSYRGKPCKTCYFPVAVKSFFEGKITKSLLILTEDAKKTHGEKISKEMDFEEILIPFGKTEEEIWQIFSNIVDKIYENEEIVFDITHGFRAQPLVAIACLMYLRNQKNIKIKSILYGAYEARDTATGIAPVFDLRPFLVLIDWSNAVYEFKKHGNMKNFSRLINNFRIESSTAREKNSEAIKESGKILSEITDALSTFRHIEIFDKANEFQQKIPCLEKSLSENLMTKPYALLIDEVNKKLSKFARAKGKLFEIEGLDAIKELLKWYIETEQYQHAITLAREYIVIRYIQDFHNIYDYSKLIKYNFREKYQKELNELQRKLFKREALNDKEKKIASLWEETTIRNDLNHAGLTKSKEDSQGIIKSITKTVEKVLKNI